MDEKELKEVMALMEAQGWNPRLCDTAIPVLSTRVACGNPTELGDEVVEEWRPWSSEIMKLAKGVVVYVQGDSMRDAGYVEGDQVVVELDQTPHDGDVVAALVDGACVLKAFMRDDQRRPWLVPQNPDYEAIAYNEECGFTIIGIVRGFYNRSRRLSMGSMMGYINRARAAKKGRPQGKSIDSLFSEHCSPKQRDRLCEAIKGLKGKDAVLLIKEAYDAGWLKELPSYAEAKKVFGDIGAKSNYYVYRDLTMTDEEIKWAKHMLKL